MSKADGVMSGLRVRGWGLGVRAGDPWNSSQLQTRGFHGCLDTRTAGGYGGIFGPYRQHFRNLVRRNPPMPVRVAYRMVLGLIAEGLFKMPSMATVWTVLTPSNSAKIRV